MRKLLLLVVLVLGAGTIYSQESKPVGIEEIGRRVEVLKVATNKTIVAVNEISDDLFEAGVLLEKSGNQKNTAVFTGVGLAGLVALTVAVGTFGVGAAIAVGAGALVIVILNVDANSKLSRAGKLLKGKSQRKQVEYEKDPQIS